MNLAPLSRLNCVLIIKKIIENSVNSLKNYFTWAPKESDTLGLTLYLVTVEIFILESHFINKKIHNCLIVQMKIEFILLWHEQKLHWQDSFGLRGLHAIYLGRRNSSSIVKRSWWWGSYGTEHRKGAFRA